jgi:CRP-like cAMP-binding protein
MSIRPAEEPAAENLLLAQLPVHERNAVHRASEMRFYREGEMLLQANVPAPCVFFPIDAVVSVIRPGRNGQSIELALVGSDGFVGLDAFLDSGTQLNDAIVQSSGGVHQMPAEELRRQINRAGALQKALLRFAGTFMTQVAHNAMCGRYHSLESRLARWLLMVEDRAHDRDIAESPSIATALGVTVDDLTKAVGRLCATRGIVQRRHNIRIVDREGLETQACDCYEAMRH